jgi:hypothetical protein
MTGSETNSKYHEQNSWRKHPYCTVWLWRFSANGIQYIKYCASYVIFSNSTNQPNNPKRIEGNKCTQQATSTTTCQTITLPLHFQNPIQSKLTKGHKPCNNSICAPELAANCVLCQEQCQSGILTQPPCLQLHHHQTALHPGKYLKILQLQITRFYLLPSTPPQSVVHNNAEAEPRSGIKFISHEVPFAKVLLGIWKGRSQLHHTPWVFPPLTAPGNQEMEVASPYAGTQQL